MPRTYKKQAGSRSYRNYKDVNLENCLRAISEGMSHREASKTFGIPKSTIGNKLYTDKKNYPGGQCVFTSVEEEKLAKCITSMSDFGFPVNEDDLRFIVKDYLSKIGRSVERFTDNLPGRDWMKRFLSRHADLSERFVVNIKKSRAAITPEILTDYIDNLRKVLIDVPPENIWNFDETNVTDDPGARKCIVKRGTKYPVNIMNSSKSSISIMMAGSAAGDLLPPYVVYKSSKLWNTWVENGPPGTRYNNSASGWFDTAIFENWFEIHLMPTLKKRSGKKVVIGDNNENAEEEEEEEEEETNKHTGHPPLRRFRWITSQSNPCIPAGHRESQSDSLSFQLDSQIQRSRRSGNRQAAVPSHRAVRGAERTIRPQGSSSYPAVAPFRPSVHIRTPVVTSDPSGHIRTQRPHSDPASTIGPHVHIRTQRPHLIVPFASRASSNPINPSASSSIDSHVKHSSDYFCRTNSSSSRRHQNSPETDNNDGGTESGRQNDRRTMENKSHYKITSVISSGSGNNRAVVKQKKR
ncbi:uncharacterized protein LOC134210149 [Armigeres subalbatus]|uniref:uncharacterized protein LOC134210149 n=1 Tax=Armigeres subalbatus TaxID=124917 RepID=UPI002ED5F782